MTTTLHSDPAMNAMCDGRCAVDECVCKPPGYGSYVVAAARKADLKGHKLPPSFDAPCVKCGEVCILSVLVSKAKVNAGYDVLCIPCTNTTVGRPGDKIVMGKAAVEEYRRTKRMNLPPGRHN